jgi:hypothetical protein
MDLFCTAPKSGGVGEFRTALYTCHRNGSRITLRASGMTMAGGQQDVQTLT